MDVDTKQFMEIDSISDKAKIAKKIESRETANKYLFDAFLQINICTKTSLLNDVK